MRRYIPRTKKARDYFRKFPVHKVVMGDRHGVIMFANVDCDCSTIESMMATKTFLFVLTREDVMIVEEPGIFYSPYYRSGKRI